MEILIFLESLILCYIGKFQVKNMHLLYVTTGVTLIGLLDGLWLRFAISLLVPFMIYLPIQYGTFIYLFFFLYVVHIMNCDYAIWELKRPTYL